MEENWRPKRLHAGHHRAGITRFHKVKVQPDYLNEMVCWKINHRSGISLSISLHIREYELLTARAML